MYIYQSIYLYFDEEMFDFKGLEDNFIPKFYLNRDEAESIIVALKVAGKDCQCVAVIKMIVTKKNGKIINWEWVYYTKEEILKYYGPNFL